MATYLLMLDSPTGEIPVGLYGTPEEAVKAAASFGIPSDVTDIPTTNGLYERIRETGYGFDDLGVPANRRANGYTVVKFVGDRPVGQDTVSPYKHYDRVLPGDPEAVNTSGIDPDQELYF
jgi:hypothetical protein